MNITSISNEELLYILGINEKRKFIYTYLLVPIITVKWRFHSKNLGRGWLLIISTHNSLFIKGFNCAMYNKVEKHWEVISIRFLVVKRKSGDIFLLNPFPNRDPRVNGCLIFFCCRTMLWKSQVEKPNMSSLLVYVTDYIQELSINGS